MPDDLLTTERVAEYLGLSLRHVYKLLAAGELVPVTRTRPFHFRRHDLDAFIEAHRREPGDLIHLVPPSSAATSHAGLRQPRGSWRPVMNDSRTVGSGHTSKPMSMVHRRQRHAPPGVPAPLAILWQIDRMSASACLTPAGSGGSALSCSRRTADCKSALSA